VIQINNPILQNAYKTMLGFQPARLAGASLQIDAA
jgi:hypothetical protein